MSAAACQDTLARIEAYLDGDLPAAECLTIEAHCQGCPACDALVAGLRQTVGLCREAAHRPLPDDVRQRALASVRKLMER